MQELRRRLERGGVRVDDGNFGEPKLGDAATPDSFLVLMAPELVGEGRGVPLAEELGFTRLCATVHHLCF